MKHGQVAQSPPRSMQILSSTLMPDKTIFSSEVRLAVEVQGMSHPVSAVGPDRFVLVEALALEARDAELIVTINGQPRRSAIHITAQREPTREYAYSRR